MRAVRARGWGRTKRREALLLPLPPRFLLAPTRCWGKGASGQEPARGCPPLGELEGSLRLSFPQDVCWVQQDGPRLLVCWEWPWRAGLLCSGDAPEVLDGGWSL